MGSTRIGTVDYRYPDWAFRRAGVSGFASREGTMVPRRFQGLTRNDIGSRNQASTDVEAEITHPFDLGSERIGSRFVSGGGSGLSIMNSIYGSKFLNPVNRSNAGLGSSPMTDGARYSGSAVPSSLAEMGSRSMNSTKVGWRDMNYAELGLQNINSAEIGPRHMNYAELGLRRMNSAEMGSRDMNSAEMGSRHMNYAEMGSRRMNSAEMGSRHMNSAELGSRRMNSAEMGSRDVNSAEMGSRHMNYAELGSRRMNSAEMGSRDMNYAELGSRRMNSAEIGSRHMSSAELGSQRMNSAEMGSRDMNSAEMGSRDMNYAELGSRHMNSAEMGSRRMNFAEMGSPHMKYMDIGSKGIHRDDVGFHTATRREDPAFGLRSSGDGQSDMYPEMDDEDDIYKDMPSLIALPLCKDLSEEFGDHGDWAGTDRKVDVKSPDINPDGCYPVQKNGLRRQDLVSSILSETIDESVGAGGRIPDNRRSVAFRNADRRPENGASCTGRTQLPGSDSCPGAPGGRGGAQPSLDYGDESGVPAEKSLALQLCGSDGLDPSVPWYTRFIPDSPENRRVLFGKAP